MMRVSGRAIADTPHMTIGMLRVSILSHEQGNEGAAGEAMYRLLQRAAHPRARKTDKETK